MSHADRERAVARRVAIGLVVVFVALWIVRLFLGIATGSLTDQSNLAFDLVFDASAIVFSTLILLVGWAIVIFIAWFLISNPTGAAHAATNLLNALRGVGNSLATFFTSL